MEFLMFKLLRELLSPRSFGIPLLLAAILAWLSSVHYLLFHALAEGFAIVVAILLFMVAWQTYDFSRNHFLMYLGIGYFWIGVLGFFHTLAFKGMNIFPISEEPSLGSDFWITTRFAQALILLSAPLFLQRPIQRYPLFVVFGLFAGLIYWLVTARIMPPTFKDGVGLTPFKVYSEYAIIFVLALALWHLYQRRDLLDQRVWQLMLISILFTIGSELAFTFYVNVYGLSNLVGHIFKFFAFWLIFLAIVRTTLNEPFAVLARGFNTYHAIPDPTVLVDSSGIIRQANRAACEAARKPEAEVLGQSCHDLFHPAGLPLRECPVCASLANNRAVSKIELAFPATASWWEFSLTPFAEADGGGQAQRGMVHVHSDITTRKRAEMGLQENEAYFRNLFDLSPVPLWETNWQEARRQLAALRPEGIENIQQWLADNPAAGENLTHAVKLLRLNQSALDLFEAPSIKALQENLSKTFTPQYRRLLLAQLVAFQSGQTRFEGEATINSLAGKSRWIVLRAVMRPDQQDSWSRVLVSAMDISDRRQVEDALRKSEQHMQIALETNNIALWEFNPQTGATIFHPRWYTMLGYAPGELPATYETWRGLLHPDDVEQAEREIRRWLESKPPIILDIEFRARAKNGEWRHVHSHGKVVRWDAQERPLYTLGAHMDITHRRQNERRLQQQAEELAQARADIAARQDELEAARRQAEIARQETEQAKRAKSDFLANMSHEIRTPMNAILGYAQILQRGAELAPEARRAVAIIDKSGNHLLSLINDMLDLSTIQAGNMQLRPSDFDLMALLQDLAVLFQLRCSQAGLKWQAELPAAANLPVRGDELKLKQILISLLGNAVKFTERGWVDLRVERGADDGYIFHVRDSGVGIAPSALQKILEPFQADAGGKSGTGLSLAISGRMLELMGSRLQVESEAGKGSHFHFSLALPASAAPAASASQYDTVTGLAEGCLVDALVVDDIPLNREVLCKILNSVGVETHEAGSGAAALEYLRVAQPDIIFMDYRMDGMDGLETTRQIRANYGNGLKIVMFSASLFPDQRQLYQEAGCDSCISKPFRVEDVLARLAELLQVRYEYRA
jgi:PAS domain S-box-containing protein